MLAMHWRKICIRTYTLPPLLVDVQQQHKHNQLLLSVSSLDCTKLFTRLYLLFYLVLNGSDQGFLVTFDISINWKEECTSVLAFQVYVLNLPIYLHSFYILQCFHHCPCSLNLHFQLECWRYWIISSWFNGQLRHSLHTFHLPLLSTCAKTVISSASLILGNWQSLQLWNVNQTQFVRFCDEKSILSHLPSILIGDQ